MRALSNKIEEEEEKGSKDIFGNPDKKVEEQNS